MFTAMDDPAAIARAFMTACNANDLDGVMRFFTNESVIQVVPPPPPPDSGIYAGWDHIRSWFEPRIERLLILAHSYAMHEDTVTWEVTMATDMLRYMGIDFLDGSVQAVVQHGKMMALTIYPSPEAVIKLHDALLPHSITAPAASSESPLFAQQ